MGFAEFIGANRHTIAIAQSYFGGVSVDIRFRLRLTGLPSTVAIGGFASAKQCHLKTTSKESVVFRRFSTFTSRKTRVSFSCITSIFIKYMSPRDLVGEINSEF